MADRTSSIAGSLGLFGKGSIRYSDYNEGSLNRSIYPSTDRPSPPVIDTVNERIPNR